MTTTVATHDAWTVVQVVGTIDVATAPALRSRLQELQFGGARHLVVDLDGVEFLDSFGLGVLVGAHKRARNQGGRLALRCNRERLLHLLELTGLRELWPVVAELADLPT